MNEREQLNNVIVSALHMVYEWDQYLVNNCYRDHVGERSVAFRFGIYFDFFSKEYFSSYNVDMEYDRNMRDLKRLPSWKDGSRPDFIVHKRGTNCDNLLIMEIKIWWNTNQENDQKKIIEFCNPNGCYKYKYGALVLIGKKESNANIILLSAEEWEQYGICRI